MLPSIGIVFLAIGYAVCEDSSEAGPRIQTNYGPIEGLTETLNDGTTKINVFLGIPFAEPPIGKLRFEKPRTPKKWTTTLETKTVPASCPPTQRKYIHVLGDKIDEDCLYLNIVAPSEPSTEEGGYPVLVWIHGGAFALGSTAQYGYKALAEHFVSRGIIVVAIQYRVGPLGFAAWGDDNFPGNYGLWDQRQALRFVWNNIVHFSGNQKRVTIWGESAGAASVSALSLSTQTNHLFANAIQNSASAYAEWATSNRVIAATEEYADHFKCEIKDAKKMKACFQKLTLDELYDAGDKFSPMVKLSDRLFTPRLDADFFTDDFNGLLAKAKPKPTMIGIASEEYLILALIDGSIAELPDFSREKFIKKVEEFAGEELFKEKASEVQRKIVDFYLNPKNAPTKKDNVYYFKKFVQLFSDVYINVPVLNEIRSKTQAKWPVYSYLTTYANKGLIPEQVPINKPTHGYEIPYIFNKTQPGFIRNEDDFEFTRILVETMAAFVKTGDPSVPGIKWPAATAVDFLTYLELKPFAPEVKKPLMMDRYQFWTLLTKHYEFDLIKGLHKETLRSRDEL
uniref:COesterase domain-containing protein n=1 Tax=Panagrellus redivivus TaxID=6233 RepID=A0A7E4ZZ30_PANRE